MPDMNPQPAEPSTTMRSKGRTTESACLGKIEAARKLHFVLQGKGGVGKTMAALLLSQVIAETGEPVMCIDTDPVNASFSSLSSLPSDRISIFNRNKVDTQALDVFTERLLTEDAHFVIDNGASSFVPVSHYLLENDVSAMLVEEGRLPVVHVMVTGGPSMLDTMKGLSSILEDFPSTVRIVVWLNEFFGPVMNANGKGFEDLPIYTQHRDRIFAIVTLPQFSEEATSDLRDMITKRMTFGQALQKDNTSILRMQKSRLFKIRQHLWPQIGQVI
jgi:hypothetical protein